MAAPYDKRFRAVASRFARACTRSRSFVDGCVLPGLHSQPLVCRWLRPTGLALAAARFLLIKTEESNTLKTDCRRLFEQLVGFWPVEILPEGLEILLPVRAVVHEVGVLVNVKNDHRECPPYSALIVCIAVVDPQTLLSCIPCEYGPA